MWNTRLLKRLKTISWHCSRVTVSYKFYDLFRMHYVLHQQLATIHFTSQHQCHPFNNNRILKELVVVVAFKFKASLVRILNWVEALSICKLLDTVWSIKKGMKNLYLPAYGDIFLVDISFLGSNSVDVSILSKSYLSISLSLNTQKRGWKCWLAVCINLFGNSE